MSVVSREFNVYFGCSVFMSVLTIILPVLRLYIVRRRGGCASYLWAELFYGFAWSTNFPYQVWVLVSATKELNIRRRVATEEEVIAELVNATWLKVEFAMIIISITTIWAVKAAFLLFYWDLAKRGYYPNRVVRYVLQATAVTLCVTYIVEVVVVLTVCSPLSFSWHLDNDTFCFALISFWPQTLCLAFSIVTDLLILGIPLLLFQALTNGLKRVEKRLLPLIFMIGMLTLLTSLPRYICAKNRGLLPKYPGELKASSMVPQALHQIAGLANAEIFCAFLAFALPAFRFLLMGSFWGRKKDQVLHLSKTATVWHSSRKRKREVSDTELLRSTESNRGNIEATTSVDRSEKSMEEV